LFPSALPQKSIMLDWSAYSCHKEAQKPQKITNKYFEAPSWISLKNKSGRGHAPARDAYHPDLFPSALPQSSIMLDWSAYS